MSRTKANNTLLDQLISKIPADVKKFVQKQGQIAAQFASILEKKGMTQKEFARKAGMKESRVSKILSGNANMTLKTITSIEAILNEDIITVPMFKSQSEVRTATISSGEHSGFTKWYQVPSISYKQDELINGRQDVNFGSTEFKILIGV